MRRREVFHALAGLAAAKFAAAQSSTGPAPSAQVLDLVAANRILYAQGVVDAFGHVSVRTAPGSSRYLLARSIAPAQVTSRDIIEYDLDSNAVTDKRAGYRERFIHGEIYRARPEVMSVIHCHATSLIPFSISNTPMRPVYHNSAFIGQGVPVFDIHDAAGDTDMLISSNDLARALAKTLADKPAVLMRGHGAVIVAKNLPDCVARAVYLEVNARVQAQALQLGSNPRYLYPGEAEKRAQDDYGRAWDLWKSQVSDSVR